MSDSSKDSTRIFFLLSTVLLDLYLWECKCDDDFGSDCQTCANECLIVSLFFYGRDRLTATIFAFRFLRLFLHDVFHE